MNDVKRLQKAHLMQIDKSFHLLTIMITQDYDSWTITNDICMLHLEESADLSSQYIGTIGTSVQTKNICLHGENICSGLPSSGQEYPSGHMCTVSGWGTTSEGGALARILQKVEKIFSNNKKNICFHTKNISG